MGGVRVDLLGIDALAAGLHALGQDLGTTGGGLVDPGASAAGHPGLACALEHFCDRWRYGLRSAGAAVERAGDQLRTAVGGYRQVDDAVAAACR